MLEGKDLVLIVDGVGVTGTSIPEEDFDPETLAAWRTLGCGEDVLLLWHAEIDGAEGNSDDSPFTAATWAVIDRSKISGLAIRGEGRGFQTYKKLKELKARSALK